jgi:hypothetical protein
VTSRLSAEIASTAARLVVEEGLEYGPAKRRAAKLLGRAGVRTTELPDNDALEDAVRDYLALFCPDTQPVELAMLRQIALGWMERLAALRPHLAGAVWRGTATRLSVVHLQLFCDDSKQAEIALIDLGVGYDVGSIPGARGVPIDAISVSSSSRELGEPVTVVLSVCDHDDLRGALKPDSRGRSPLGDLAAVRRLMEAK